MVLEVGLLICLIIETYCKSSPGARPANSSTRRPVNGGDWGIVIDVCDKDVTSNELCLTSCKAELILNLGCGEMDQKSPRCGETQVEYASGK